MIIKMNELVVFLGLFSVVWCEQSYEVANEQIEPFKGTLQTLADFSNLKIIKRERVLNGSIVFSEDLNNEEFMFDIEVWSSPASDGNYKKVAMDVPKTAVCDGLKQFYTKFVQPSMKFDENTNFPVIPDDGLCPLPAGTYSFNSILFNTDDWPTEVPRGLLKFIVTFYKKQSVIGGMQVVISIKDK